MTVHRDGLREIFNRTASAYGFDGLKGGVVLRPTSQDETQVAISYYQARWGVAYLIMLKVYINGAFGRKVLTGQQLLQGTGDLFCAAPKDFLLFLDLGKPMPDDRRIEGVSQLFSDFVAPLLRSLRTRMGVWELAREGVFHLLPAVESELARLENAKASE